MPPSPIRRARSGDFELRLSSRERAVLRSLPTQLRMLLGTDDPSLRRLFPEAYPEDPARQADYEHLVRDDLVEERLQAAQVMAATVDADRLTREQLESWLGALNDLRLVLGTRLDVTADMDQAELPADDPRAEAFDLYLYLTWLQDLAVASIEAGR